MNKFVISALCFLAFATPVRADGPGAHAHDAERATPAIQVPADARAAVEAVDRFSAALVSGNLVAAGAELAPEVLILEAGGAERSAGEYLGGHAKGDAAFLKQAHVQLLRRTASVHGDLVWVASESELHVSRDGKPVTVLSAETMLVRRSEEGWKIVHIHWSSRTKAPDGHH
jgi:hypothetical protein